MKPGRRTFRILAPLAALALATAAWLPCLHLCFRPELADYLAPDGIAPRADGMAARHLALWRDNAVLPPEVLAMRESNPEWDFMGRTFLVLALANMSLRDAARADEYVETMDRVIDDTVRTEREQGIHHYLLPYGRDGSFLLSGGRSLFVDGEIALMLAARRLVRERDDYRTPLSERVQAMRAYMTRSPVLSGESYPDECWTFCNTVGLAAMCIGDALDSDGGAAFAQRWLSTARERLVDEQTGLLVSSFSVGGDLFDGPEGSSIWMSAHCLQLVDPEFAADQYRRARAELSERLLGFGYAREWPHSWEGPGDIDSGPVIPLLDISAGSSGMAFLGAGAFGDRAFLSALLTSLQAGGFPVKTNGRLRFAASNQVGDAVVLYALVLGPLWEEAHRRLLLSAAVQVSR